MHLDSVDNSGGSLAGRQHGMGDDELLYTSPLPLTKRITYAPEGNATEARRSAHLPSLAFGHDANNTGTDCLQFGLNILYFG
ncbi:unnamed protein product [Colias eurytheme]|nr:unnamed protein product [Colias eurytheme]